MSCTKFFARISATLLCLGTSLAFAAPHPLNYPQGLAVDAKGNLYVANTGGNQILVYNPSGLQMTAKTITTNINAPLQLTFDAQGNLWVVNLFSNTGFQEYFSEYAPSGKQINAAYTANTSHFSESSAAFAVDGIGNIWTDGVDAQDNLHLQVQNGPCAYDSGGVITPHLEPQGRVMALAAHGP